MFTTEYRIGLRLRIRFVLVIRETRELSNRQTFRPVAPARVRGEIAPPLVFGSAARSLTLERPAFRVDDVFFLPSQDRQLGREVLRLAQRGRNELGVLLKRAVQAFGERAHGRHWGGDL